MVKKKLLKQEASGGIIGIDKYGNIVMSFNTEGMFRGCDKLARTDPVISCI